MHLGKRHRKCSGGFTLLELILVMIIICTVLAMAAPTLRGFFSSRQIHDMAEQIQVLSRYARTQAVCQAQYYRLEFDINKREYGLTVLKDGSYRRLQEDFGMWYTLPADIALKFENIDRADGRYVLQFDLMGQAKECCISMEDSKNNRIDLVCLSPSDNFELIEVDESDYST